MTSGVAPVHAVAITMLLALPVLEDAVVPLAFPEDACIPDETCVPEEACVPEETCVPDETCMPDEASVPDDTCVPCDDAPCDEAPEAALVPVDVPAVELPWLEPAWEVAVPEETSTVEDAVPPVEDDDDVESPVEPMVQDARSATALSAEA